MFLLLLSGGFLMDDKTKQIKCFLVTPPLLEPQTIYPAMPLLTGQLTANGFDAQNFDLNIYFFRKIFTQKFIKKVIKLLEKKSINYEKSEADFILSNIDDAIKKFRKYQQETEDFKLAKDVLCKTLEFVSKPYDNFEMNEFFGFERTFKRFNGTFESIINTVNDTDNNIFTDIFNDAVKEIKKQNVDFIGITIPFPATIIPALTFAKILKEKTNIYVNIGGNFLKKENILSNPDFLNNYCDTVMIGDGEKSLVDLVSSLQNNQDIKNISGLIFKDENNNIQCNPPKQIKTMKDIENVSFDGINFDEYMMENPWINLMISKGCYWGKCTFCSLGPKYKCYCIKKPKEVVSNIIELKEKYNLKYNFILFQDDSIPPLYLNMLADELLKQNVNINYSIFARLEKEFTKELFEKLYKSGLRYIYWGLESGSVKILEDMQKGINLEIVPEILKNACMAGISNMAGIIVNFPTETMKEYNETIEFLSKIKEYLTISPGNFTVMKNSIVEENKEKYGVKILDYNRSNFNYSPTWEYVNISDEEKEKKWIHFCDYVKGREYSIDACKII